jgi:hypothetical protein
MSVSAHTGYTGRENPSGAQKYSHEIKIVVK